MLRMRIFPVALAVGVMVCSGPPAEGEVLFRDDFNGGSLDTGEWSVGTWRLGRTKLRGQPTVSNGRATLRVDTYDATNPGNTFRGQEIYSKTKYARGAGLELTARVRVRNMPSGLVTSFFTYADDQRNADKNNDGVNDFFGDEIDFEFLSKMINSSGSSDPVTLTSWNNWNRDDPNAPYNDGVHHTSTTKNLSNLNLSQWNVMKIRWMGNRVEWYVNGERVWKRTNVVPNLNSTVRLNFWAPDSSWSAAYSSSLQPVSNSSNNSTYYYDIDWVELRRVRVPRLSGTGTDNYVGRAGKVSVDQSPGQWRTRNLPESYSNPVVLMQPPSYNGFDPAVIRLRNVTGDSFEYQIDEWDYLDDSHGSETFGYLVMKGGAYKLSDGARVQVGKVNTTHTWTTVSFSQNFSSAPTVLAQSQTIHGSQSVTTRVRNVTASSFEVRLQEQESKGTHTTETIGYAAIERGKGIADTRYRSGRTPNEVEGKSSGGGPIWHALGDYPGSLGNFGNAVILAGMQTTDGSDPSAVRYRNLTGTSVDLFVEEEKSADSEQVHTTEQVGFFLFDLQQ